MKRIMKPLGMKLICKDQFLYIQLLLLVYIIIVNLNTREFIKSTEKTESM